MRKNTFFILISITIILASCTPAPVPHMTGILDNWKWFIPLAGILILLWGEKILEKKYYSNDYPNNLRIILFVVHAVYMIYTFITVFYCLFLFLLILSNNSITTENLVSILDFFLGFLLLFGTPALLAMILAATILFLFRKILPDLDDESHLSTWLIILGIATILCFFISLAITCSASVWLYGVKYTCYPYGFLSGKFLLLLNSSNSSNPLYSPLKGTIILNKTREYLLIFGTGITIPKIIIMIGAFGTFASGIDYIIKVSKFIFRK